MVGRPRLTTHCTHNAVTHHLPVTSCLHARAGSSSYRRHAFTFYWVNRLYLFRPAEKATFESDGWMMVAGVERAIFPTTPSPATKRFGQDDRRTVSPRTRLALPAFIVERWDITHRTHRARAGGDRPAYPHTPARAYHRAFCRNPIPRRATYYPLRLPFYPHPAWRTDGESDVKKRPTVNNIIMMTDIHLFIIYYYIMIIFRFLLVCYTAR